MSSSDPAAESPIGSAETAEPVVQAEVVYEPEAELAVGPSNDSAQSEVAAPPAEQPPPKLRRRIVLPIVLFVLTCLSTFFAGVTGWVPHEALLAPLETDMPVSIFRPALLHWREGLLYMACVLAILLAHEMGHFVMTVVYRVQASFPYFIPLPISPIGTMGAVIGMDGLKANRREIFDIGLAGPLAGLVVAVPIIWLGTAQLNLQHVQKEAHSLELPLAMRMLVDHLHPGEYKPEIGVPLSRVNAYFMAGWVGLLVTGLNMLPVSQLDGGHVTYALFGRWAHWLARAFMLGAFIYMGVSYWLWEQHPQWIVMALLVLLIGTDHPPTRDDTAQLGWGRIALGVASLAIPVFCFVPHLKF